MGEPCAKQQDHADCSGFRRVFYPKSSGLLVHACVQEALVRPRPSHHDGIRVMVVIFGCLGET